MRKPEVLLTLALLGSASVSLWLWGELKSQRAHVEELTTRLARFDSQSRGATTSDDATLNAEGTVTQAAVSPAPAASRSRAREEPSVDHDPNERERRLASNPAYREALRQKRRLEFQTNYRDMQRVLRISRAKADEVMNYLVENALASLDRPWPNPTNEEELRQRRLDIEAFARQRDADLTEILGAQGAARFKEFTESMSSRSEAYELRTALGNGAEALRDDQFELLVLAMYAEHQASQQAFDEFRRTQSGKEFAPQQQAARSARYQELIADTDRRIHVAASGILSSTQLATLDELRRTQREQRAAQERLFRMQAEFAASEAVAKTERKP